MDLGFKSVFPRIIAWTCENYFISPCHNFSVKDLFCKKEGCVPVIYYYGTNDQKVSGKNPTVILLYLINCVGQDIQ